MSGLEQDWSYWRNRFAEREDRALPALETDHDYTRLPTSVGRSLAVFQLGESGGGTVVGQARRSELSGIDSAYADALELFVAEEHRHANLLAMCVRLTGGQLLRKNWTARLFVAARRLLGLRLKILVFLTAEVVGLVFYGLLAERLPPGVLRRWLEEIIEDEGMHLAFHSAFLRSQSTGKLHKLVFLAGWRLLNTAAGLVVLIDHRRTLRDLYIEPRTARAAWIRHRRAVEQRVLGENGADLQEISAARCSPV